jgi:hypothetical protein
MALLLLLLLCVKKITLSISPMSVTDMQSVQFIAVPIHNKKPLFVFAILAIDKTNVLQHVNVFLHFALTLIIMIRALTMFPLSSSGFHPAVKGHSFLS